MNLLKMVKRALFVLCLSHAFLHNAVAFTLTSSQDTFNGTGKFLGPGSFKGDQALFEMQLKNLAFTNSSDFIVPYLNNSSQLPNVCAEYDIEEKPDGKLSDGTAFNENADMCLANIAGTDMHIAVVNRGALQGQIHCLILADSEILVTMNIAFDLGIGDKGVIHMPFYGTTGKVEIPYSLQTQLGMPGGTDSAGAHASGTWLQGRVGDFDEDSFIDGTLVSVGNIPLDSPVFPGQPYAMVRHFVLDIPLQGYWMGNVAEILDDVGGL